MKTENNKKLAEFLGLTIITDGISYFDTYFKPLKDYDKDWNSLMEVVEKIESLNISVLIGKNNCVIEQTFGKTSIGLGLIKGETKIEAVYKACIEFVEWYNKEQSNNTVINSLDEWAKSGFAGIETMFGGK